MICTVYFYDESGFEFLAINPIQGFGELAREFINSDSWVDFISDVGTIGIELLARNRVDAWLQIESIAYFRG